VRFHVLPANTWPPSSGSNEVYLTIDHWNDYSFVTMFGVYAFDQEGNGHQLSSVKIGFLGQTTDVSTHDILENGFESLPEGFFSLGTRVEYYKVLHSNFNETWRQDFLASLQDVVWNQNILKTVEDEDVFETSHLRGIKVTEIRDQFASVLRGDVLLTDFDFSFILPPSEKFAGFNLTFSVEANSTPSTNMHALIGRNGVGKTTLLNSMVKAVVDQKETDAQFSSKNNWGGASRDR